MNILKWFNSHSWKDSSLILNLKKINNENGSKGDNCSEPLSFFKKE